MSSAPVVEPAVLGWPAAFRGSVAVRAGVVTWDVLLGPRYQRLFPDIYVPRADDPPDLALRSRAAYRYVEGRGALCGYSAAEVLGASCGPPDAPAEVIVPGGGQRPHPGLLVRRDRIAPGEMCWAGDLRVTSPVRTAFDLARQDDLTEGVVAVDALANAGRFAPDLLLNFAVRYPRARGQRRVADVLAHADLRAGSPMESRLRMAIVLGGLPRPEVQWVVQDEQARTAVWLDMAYPQHKIGIEYEGGGHTRPEAVLRDVSRYTRLVAQGWRIHRYTMYEVYGEPDRIVADLAGALAA